MAAREYKFSKHAETRLRARGITYAQIEEVLNNPQKVISQSECVTVYQGKVTSDGILHLLRIFINTCKDPNLIITAYKTSKMEKYES